MKLNSIISKVLWFFCLAFFTQSVQGQSNPPDSLLIQFSGFLITSDSASPIPYANIQIKNEPRGAISNLEGFFSMVVEPKDTILFGSMGFKKASFVVPASVSNNKLNRIQTLQYDTFKYEETVVRPLPNKEEFREAFLNLKLPGDQYKAALKNLKTKKLNEVNKKIPLDALENYNYAIQQRHDQSFYSGGNRRYYTAPGSGTPIPGSLLNPSAWA